MEYTQRIDLSNAPAIASLVHTAKLCKELGYQELTDLAMEKVKELLNKELGVVLLMNIANLPTNSSIEESVDKWLKDIKDRGLIIVDDSSINIKNS